MQRVNQQLDFNVDELTDQQLQDRFGEMAEEVINKRQELAELTAIKDQVDQNPKPAYLNRQQRRNAARQARKRAKADKRRHNPPIRPKRTWFYGAREF